MSIIKVRYSNKVKHFMSAEVKNRSDFNRFSRACVWTPGSPVLMTVLQQHLVWQGMPTVNNLLAQLFKLHLPGRAWLSWQSTHFREISNIFHRISIFGSSQQVIMGHVCINIVSESEWQRFRGAAGMDALGLPLACSLLLSGDREAKDSSIIWPTWSHPHLRFSQI